MCSCASAMLRPASVAVLLVDSIVANSETTTVRRVLCTSKEGRLDAALSHTVDPWSDAELDSVHRFFSDLLISG